MKDVNKKKKIIFITSSTLLVIASICSSLVIFNKLNNKNSNEPKEEEKVDEAPKEENIEIDAPTEEEEKNTEEKTEEENKDETTIEKDNDGKTESTSNEKPTTSTDKKPSPTTSTKKKSYVEALSTKTIMSLDEINSYNKKISSKTDALYNVKGISSMTAKKITNYITSYKAPTLPKYNGSKKVTSSELQKILDNRNLDEVKDQNTIQKGLIVQRSNLRSLPTNVHFYSSTSKKYLDNIQETELLVNTPVLILHESSDGDWNFVLAPNYYGWVEKKNIALATTDDWNYFLRDSNFVVVTSAKVTVDGITLDMSVKLPYNSTNGSSYNIVLPKRDSNGKVTKKNVTISKDKANLGYLPYSQKNVYNQAVKYKGTAYQFGGYTGGVDCSSFVANVFRTFGFQFPRNTSNQNSSVGEIISLSNKSNSQKLSLIEKHPASLLYQSGHVMIYLGKENGKHYIIHANATTLNVAITVLDGSKNLSNINKIVLIEK